jgi:hypothetical protein
MRTGQPIISRPAWYDRNPSSQWLGFFNNNTPPHSDTQRWTYTVPSGKKAMLEYASAYVRRSAAATTVGRVQASIRVTPSGGGVHTITIAQILTNNVGDSDRMDLGQGFLLFAGDKIEGYTEDTSTGGTVNILLRAKLTEFDA